jgi:two-component system LytT family response regulator
MAQKKFSSTRFFDSGKIIFRSNGKLILVKTCDILFCKAEGSYTRLYFVNVGNSILISKPIKCFEIIFIPIGFKRIHRSYLINIQFVNFFSSNKNSIQLENHSLPICRRKSAEIFSELLLTGICDKTI